MKKIFTVVMFVNMLHFVKPAFSQDFHLSQYDAFSLYLNPSLTGLFNGNLRVHGHYRNQWGSVTTPFTTSSVSADMPYKEKYGIGVLIINDRAGYGNYNVLKFTPSFSYDIRKKHHHLSLGLQVGIIHKSVNLDKLRFGNQYTNMNSRGFDPGLPTGEIFENTSIVIPDLNAGFTYYFSNDQFRINPFIGGTVFHITQPTESFFSTPNKLPRRYLIHSGVKINLTPAIQFTPQMLYMRQRNANETVLSFLVNYYLRNQDAWIFGGPTYRVFTLDKINKNDALIMLFGLKYLQFTYRFSYDINTSSLRSISGGKGGFELSITYIAKKVQKQKPACPRL